MSSALSMIGTAESSLCAFSSAACPPRLKMPTLYPVFPRFRVGMEFEDAEFEADGLDGRGSEAFDSAVAISAREVEPRTAAVSRPPALRKSRRLRLGDLSD